MKNFQEHLEEYKESDEKRGNDIWLMFIGLKDQFDQMERKRRNTYPKFVLELCDDWCDDWKILS